MIRHAYNELVTTRRKLYVMLTIRLVHYSRFQPLHLPVKQKEGINQGRIQDFKLGGSHFKKLRRAEGGRRENVWGISCEKSPFQAKKIISFPILGGSAPCSPPPLDPPLIQELRVAESSSYPLHPAFDEKSKNHCGQLQCISSTLYSLTSINCVVTIRGVADCRNLTDGRTDEHQVFEQRV